MNREEAQSIYAQAQTPGDIKALLLGDLFFLMVHGMSRKDMDNDFIYDRCREVQLHSDGYLDLWARDHYKSTIITVGLSIQEILNNPEVTICIFSHTRPIAKAFLRQIKREFETNKILQDLFSHVMPPSRGDSRTWSEDNGLVVRRRGNPKESTVEAWGVVDGQPTGKHFNILVYDDVVTKESVYTPEQIKNTTDSWRLSLNLGSSRDCRIRYIGTRYHANDTYQEIMNCEAATPRIIPATDTGTEAGNPVYLTRETLTEKRKAMGKYVFACQMLQNPLADKSQGFEQDWLRYYTVPEKIPASWNVYILVDPASAQKKTSDYTVMAAVALAEDGHYRLLDGVRDRMNLAERTRRLFALHRKWRPRLVGYERYGMQADIEHIKHIQETTHYVFQVRELGGQMPKVDRIKRLVPVFESGRFLIPHRLLFQDVDGNVRNFVNEFITDEYSTFPVSKHDDMLDCLSRICDPGIGAQFPSLSDTSVDIGGIRMAKTEYNILAV